MDMDTLPTTTASRGPYAKRRHRDRHAERMAKRLTIEHNLSVPITLVRRYCQLHLLTSEIAYRISLRPTGPLKADGEEVSSLTGEFRRLCVAEATIARLVFGIGGDRAESVTLSPDAIRRIESIHAQQQGSHADNEADDE